MIEIENFQISIHSYLLPPILGGSFISPTASFRIAAFMSRIPPLLLYSAYSGVIASFLLVQVVTYPFKNLEGLIQNRSFKIYYENDTFLDQWFKVNSYIIDKEIWCFEVTVTQYETVFSPRRPMIHY